MSRKKQTKWYECKITLSNGDVIDLVHNMGTMITNAFDNWLVRTDTYNAESLCDYINSKREKGMSDHICLTRAQYDELAE